MSKLAWTRGIHACMLIIVGVNVGVCINIVIARRLHTYGNVASPKQATMPQFNSWMSFQEKSKTTWYHMIYIYIRVYHIYWHIYCICNPVKTTLVVVRKKPVLRLYEIVFLKWRIPKTVGFNTDMIQYWMIWGPPRFKKHPKFRIRIFSPSFRHVTDWHSIRVAQKAFHGVSNASYIEGGLPPSNASNKSMKPWNQHSRGYLLGIKSFSGEPMIVSWNQQIIQQSWSNLKHPPTNKIKDLESHDDRYIYIYICNIII